MARLIYLLPLLLVLNSCFISRWHEARKAEHALVRGEYIDPPGCVEVGPNFYVDEEEITNFNWLEYEYWTKRIFGGRSPEFQTTVILEDNWLPVDTCLAEYYLRHPTYRNYPLVNVTPEQAVNYARWRSDRVFEYLLIRSGRIDWNPNQDADGYFTRERYFAGLYLDSMPDPAILYYPEYHLVSLDEAKRIDDYNDSLMALKGNRFITGKSRSSDENISCDPDERTLPVTPVTASCRLKKGSYICNFDTNVAEWRIDSAERYLSVNGDTIGHDTAAATNTGFRLVCVWKKRP